MGGAVGYVGLLGCFVVCIRILLVRPEDLQKQFEQEAAASAKTPSKYAKNLLEYCSFRALSVSAQVAEHLNDKDFRRLSYDMMLAWEAPDATSSNPKSKVINKYSPQQQQQHKVLCCVNCDTFMLNTKKPYLSKSW
jgi:hypothetical protein